VTEAVVTVLAFYLGMLIVVGIVRVVNDVWG
jgi:hypothetical protein